MSKGSNQKAYYLGLDVSKGYADFIILDRRKNSVEDSFQLDDTFDGHRELYEILTRFFDTRPEAVLYAGLESTGGYENNWYNRLRKFQDDMNIKVARMNPAGIKFHSKAGLKRNTTDKISARNIAEYLISYEDKVTYEDQDYYASVRKLWNFIALLNKQKSQLLNQLESLLYIAHPQLLKHCRNGITHWILKLIKRYPTAIHLARARVSAVAKIPYISTERAVSLVEDAKSSVASTTDGVIKGLIQTLSVEILQLQRLITQQSKKIVDMCNLPEIELLKSLKGISNYSAVGLLIEIGAIERFPTVKHLASYFGLHPVYKISGDGVWRSRMSKQGRVRPREILFNVALSAIKSDPHIQAIYLELVDRGMEKMAAIGVIMHKILRIVYGILKNNQPYCPETDQANRATVFDKKQRPVKDKSRRYQSVDENAPISRRQMKKRKERKESQNDHIIMHGIITTAHKQVKTPQQLSQIIQRFASRNMGESSLETLSNYS